LGKEGPPFVGNIKKKGGRISRGVTRYPLLHKSWGSVMPMDMGLLSKELYRFPMMRLR